ncbi:MAG: nucleotide exchange factor GrpE [Clostridia bacterium]|nr:nucleotide exchange factor GrpE [Clostridia bacterium]
MTDKTMQNSEVQDEEVSLKELQEEIEKLKGENEKYYDHLQRTAAEFDNYKKRVSKEKEKIYNLAVGDVMTKFISVLDNLEKATLAESTDEKLKEGVTLIHKQMADLFTSLNVEQIKTVKETFNPDIHDAVMHVEDKEYGEQEVIEELRSGYKMGDRVLRHAMVKVAN